MALPEWSRIRITLMFFLCIPLVQTGQLVAIAVKCSNKHLRNKLGQLIWPKQSVVRHFFLSLPSPIHTHDKEQMREELPSILFCLIAVYRVTARAAMPFMR